MGGRTIVGGGCAGGVVGGRGRSVRGGRGARRRTGGLGWELTDTSPITKYKGWEGDRGRGKKNVRLFLPASRDSDDTHVFVRGNNFSFPFQPRDQERVGSLGVKMACVGALFRT